MMATRPEHDLVVIGAGPGGYVAAIRAAQLGLNVACVERETALGGTCLRVGCIPSKALLESSEVYASCQDRIGTHGVRLGAVTLDLRVMLQRKEGTVGALTRGIDGLFRKHKITRYTGHGGSQARVRSSSRMERTGSASRRAGSSSRRGACPPSCPASRSTATASARARRR
jgi:pyruvate/2-oxoglutarate dehydrogenase complex dihydrolipoamide dehydrogenase (E3) component